MRPPLADRVALWLIVPALLPYVVALCGAWWFIRHGDDGKQVGHVGPGLMAVVLSIFLWVALASALSTALLLLARPSVYWHRAIPIRRVTLHLVGSGLVAIIALHLLADWDSPVPSVAGLALPYTCTFAFIRAMTPSVPRAVVPLAQPFSTKGRVALFGFAAVAIAAIVVLELARTIGERETIAAYGFASWLALPWSLVLHPATLLSGFAGVRGDSEVIFDVFIAIGLVTNATLAIALAANRRLQLWFVRWFFRVGA